MTNDLIDFYLKSHPVTIGVLILLSVYFIVLNWVFFYRYFTLNSWYNRENNSLEALLMGATTIDESSFLNNFIKDYVIINILILLDEKHKNLIKRGI